MIKEVRFIDFHVTDLCPDRIWIVTCLRLLYAEDGAKRWPMMSWIWSQDHTKATTDNNSIMIRLMQSIDKRDLNWVN